MIKAFKKKRVVDKSIRKPIKNHTVEVDKDDIEAFNSAEVERYYKTIRKSL